MSLRSAALRRRGDAGAGANVSRAAAAELCGRGAAIGLEGTVCHGPRRRQDHFPAEWTQKLIPHDPSVRRIAEAEAVKDEPGEAAPSLGAALRLAKTVLMRASASLSSGPTLALLAIA